MMRRIICLIVLALGISTLSPANTAHSAGADILPENAAQGSSVTPVQTVVPAALLQPTPIPSPLIPVPLVQSPVQPPPVQQPLQHVQLPLVQMVKSSGIFILNGTHPEGHLEFDVRRDQVVSQAELIMAFTPSPSLTPMESNVKVYLNDQMVGMITLTKEQLGRLNTVNMPIDPHYITDFNRIRLIFSGYEQGTCHNPGDNHLWVDISQSSSLKLQLQALALENDLSHFPEPFFDSHDTRPLVLPMMFATQPTLAQQRAAAILASWFGSQAQWRGQSFPVLFNQLPTQHGIVFATNQQRPDFMRDAPPVEGPTVEMISLPDNPYIKLLLIQGRDDNDLIMAVKGIAQGNILFRGQRVTIDKVEQLAARQPYDAPNWVRTDRPMTFVELQKYAEQLQTSGIDSGHISLVMILPPDLFLLHNNGINMRLKYRYTPPHAREGAHLSVKLNNHFLRAYELQSEQDQGAKVLRLPMMQGLFDADRELYIPALELGTSNQLNFDFDYPVLISSGEGCEVYSMVPNYAVIDGDSSIDFSGYRHFIAMPDLRVFSNAGFPFSRMADLSETLVLVSQHPQPVQVSVLLNTLGMVGSQTGYPALGMTLSDDWSQARDRDADILLIGVIPPELRDDKKISLLVDATQSWVKQPSRQLPSMVTNITASDVKPVSKTTTHSDGAISAIIGVQSPFHAQRSIVALLADSQQGYELLNEALLDSGKRAVMFGSAIVIRQSGVDSLRIGDIYYVGYLPWWERVRYALLDHPIGLVVIVILVAVILGLMVWRSLKAFSRRRLSPDDQD